MPNINLHKSHNGHCCTRFYRLGNINILNFWPWKFRSMLRDRKTGLTPFDSEYQPYKSYLSIFRYLSLFPRYCIFIFPEIYLPSKYRSRSQPLSKVILEHISLKVVLQHFSPAHTVFQILTLYCQINLFVTVIWHQINFPFLTPGIK